MTEPDVALTDFGLAVECGVFVWLLSRTRASSRTIQFGFLLFFAGVGVAAFLGGVLHGFLAEVPTPIAEAVWLGILVCAGLSALACWAIGGKLLFGAKGARRALLVGILLCVLYLAAVLFLFRDFRVVVVNSAVASLFLLAAFLRRRVLWGAAGAGLMLAAGALQEAGFGLHPVYFTRDALYHVVVGIALALIYRAAAALPERTLESG